VTPPPDVPADPAGTVSLPTGVALRYIERGRGEAVLLLHGGMGDCQSWQPQVEAFSRWFRVLAFSRRHSAPNTNAPAGPAYRMSDDVDDLAAFVAALQIAPCHLVATSYGALVALAFAIGHPTQVRSLALCEPPLHGWARRTHSGRHLHDAFMADVWLPARHAFDEDDPRGALRLLVDGMWGSSVFNGFTQSRSAAALRNAPAMHALTRMEDAFSDLAREQVAALAVPILLLRGQHASALHTLVLQELAATLPHAGTALIAGAGHGAAAECPRLFNAAVLKFLRRARAIPGMRFGAGPASACGCVPWNLP
jgi:pimeloyl-ACP methyl ester carboxylesterase